MAVRKLGGVVPTRHTPSTPLCHRSHVECSAFWQPLSLASLFSKAGNVITKKQNQLKPIEIRHACVSHGEYIDY